MTDSFRALIRSVCERIGFELRNRDSTQDRVQCQTFVNTVMIEGRLVL
jgi:hypothetical protein